MVLITRGNIVHCHVVDAFAPTRAEEVNRAMAGRLKQPRAECRWIRERRDALEHGEPHLLLNVVGVVSEQAPQIAQCLLSEFVEERRERTFVARLAPQHQELQLQ